MTYFRRTFKKISKVISKNSIKLIKSLEYRKYRLVHQLFLAEGNKMVTDLLRSRIKIRTIIGTPEFLQGLNEQEIRGIELTEAKGDEIRNASLLRNPQDALAICHIPEDSGTLPDPSRNLVICLDNIQDPGNLGTIVRIADWFGVMHVVCSPGTADIFNPKAVQATMGSIGRVKVSYFPLAEWLGNAAAEGNFIAGTFLGGENLYSTELSPAGILVMGNEGKGISEEVVPFIGKRIHIPSFSADNNHAESLNVAMATAVVCSEFRRRYQ
mgnify:CR=1 FL=1